MKNKKTIIIIAIIVCIVLTSPFWLFYGIAGIIAIDSTKKPDHSNDLLIPSGYVETDGKKSYGAGDHEDFCYYVYESKPELDSNFKEVTTINDNEKLAKLFDHYRYDNDDDEEHLNSKNLTGRISEGDYYYIEKVYDTKFGGLVYFYDTDENILYRLDYRW